MFSPQQAQALRKNQIFVQPAHSQETMPQLGHLHLPSGLSSALDQIHAEDAITSVAYKLLHHLGPFNLRKSLLRI